MVQLKTNKGFTIIEVLVSVGVLLVFLPFVASMMTNSRLLASYSKHKIQAAYAAQQIIETQRQQPFTPLTPGQSFVIGPASVVLDTKGNYTDSNCATNLSLFCGNVIITMTPAVYTNGAGVQTTNTAINHVVVTITWTEQIVKFQVPVSEIYAEDIANDPMLN